MKKRIYLAFIVILTSGLVWAQKTVTNTYTGIESIRLSTSSGNGIIKKSSSNTVKVELVYTYDDRDFEPIMEQNGSRLRLKEEFGRGSFSGRSTWTLEVPDGIRLNFNTGSGDLTASTLDIDLRSNLGSGDVEVDNIKGEISVNVGSGSVDIVDAEATVDVNTGSGNIDVSNTTGDIDLNAGSGNIRISGSEASFSVNVGSGDVHARNVILADRSSFNCGSGDAEVSLSKAADFDISVNSGSGDAVLDFGGNAINGDVVMEADERRGRIIAPFDFDKEEEIERGRNVILRKSAKIGSKDVKINVSTGSGVAEIKE